MLRRLSAFAVVLAACPPPTAGGTDGDPTTGTSTTTGESTTSTSTAPTTSTGGDTAAPSPDLSPPCPVGSLGCPCTEGGSCDGFLTCEAGTCAEGCAVGSLGCPCTQGLGCDAGLKCDDAGTCVDDPMLSPPCEPGVNMDDCCGDGVLDEFEDCDKGMFENSDAGDCTTLCTAATCGDGFTWTNHEACDGGEHCSAVCTFTTCGDHKVDPWEWCEPRGAADPECTALCGDGRKVIFVSSVHYKGGEIGSILGGLAGADARCQELALNAGLPGDFKAWLSTGPMDAPIVRFAWFDGPYVEVNGQVIADTWWKIYKTASVLAPNVTELGTITADSEVEWSGFRVSTRKVTWASPLDGTIWKADDPRTCGGWGWNDSDGFGSVAILDHDPAILGQVGERFAVNWYGADCDKPAPIICVEQ